ncbi:acyl dehydratase [Acrocarpospora pleiomorpha]|uniref:Acyl dehydratase n=1 Tax=Acrocarpospora pleiomorpha TaxID=90975 RepID=A0A5M3XDY7_9ACTN|nr:MaoC family dehydratase [Acrocarpospora pleiomorpha]GES19474.1 acyl dehydratase [Acrocarpospora pleiomorpha]
MQTLIDGPYFEDLRHGQRFGDGPGLTLTEGLAAAHQAIVGGRLPLVLDHELSRRVTGEDAALAGPNLVWDIAIGQSTVATHTVTANLFYRGVVFRRAPRIGDTLRTVTEVVGLRQNSRRAGRRATGLAALRISTRDQHDRPVLDFWRCAMLPLREEERETGHADDLSAIGAAPAFGELARVTADWDLDAYRARVRGRPLADLTPGDVFHVAGGDVVTSAPELARLTLNVAKVHHDASGGAGRLVYGGHTIGIALHQAVRALPEIVTVVGWHGCDHVDPVREGDTLTSTIEVEQTERLARGGLARLRSRVRARRDGLPPADVLDWRFVVMLAG